MKPSARLFNCARCQCQVMICSHCDRGNIYCGVSCSQSARRDALRAAGRRYQRSRRGRFQHAERQRRYRSRRQKVTHQGSVSAVANAVLSTESKGWDRLVQPLGGMDTQEPHCHFCRCPCSAFVRLGFLPRTASRLAFTPWDWPPPAG
jgi:hypothetical protein